MAEISGVDGAVYFNEEITPTVTSGNLFFSTGKTITSSGATLDFVDEGFTSGMLITVEGCTKDVVTSGTTTGNNRIYTIDSVTTGVLTVAEDIAVSSNPDASTGLTITEAEPGVTVLGFYNWSLSYTGDTLETTNFDNSSGGRNYIPGMISWTATADKHFLTANNEVDDWVGETCELRLFLNYVAAPDIDNPSQYWKGDTIVTGLDHTTPVDALVTQSISFQGDRALTLKTQIAPWSCGISA